MFLDLPRHVIDSYPSHSHKVSVCHDQENYWQHLREEALPSLKVLWLSDNPCADLPGYEAYVCGMLPQLQMLDNMCTAGKLREKVTQGIDCHIGEDGVRSVTVDQLEFARAKPGTYKACGQQTAANVLITTEANPAAMDNAKRHLGNHVGHADTMPPTCHGSISELHARKQSVLQTVAKCDALNTEQSMHPQCTLVSLTSSSTARVSSSCFNVYIAVTHLLKELEDRRDWNALIALKHDIERRLDDTMK